MSAKTYRFIPNYSDEEIARIQLEGLRNTIARAMNSPQYRGILAPCGVQPGDIRSLDDIRQSKETIWPAELADIVQGLQTLER